MLLLLRECFQASKNQALEFFIFYLEIPSWTFQQHDCYDHIGPNRRQDWQRQPPLLCTEEKNLPRPVSDCSPTMGGSSSTARPWKWAGARPPGVWVCKPGALSARTRATSRGGRGQRGLPWRSHTTSLNCIAYESDE